MYDKMTAAELREVVTHLPDGLQRECYYGMGYWYRTDGQSISVPQAAEMLERACINFLTDNGYKSACAHYIEQNKVVSAWIKETHNSVGQQNVQGTGPTQLHALVKAIEQVGNAGKANSNATQVAETQVPATDHASVKEAKAPLNSSTSAFKMQSHSYRVDSLHIRVVNNTHPEDVIVEVYQDDTHVETLSIDDWKELAKQVESSIDTFINGKTP